MIRLEILLGDDRNWKLDKLRLVCPKDIISKLNNTPTLMRIRFAENLR